jgi:hypothetical protein
MIEGLIRPQHLITFLTLAVALVILWEFFSLFKLFKRFVISLESIAESLREWRLSAANHELTEKTQQIGNQQNQKDCA